MWPSSSHKGSHNSTVMKSFILSVVYITWNRRQSQWFDTRTRLFLALCLREAHISTGSCQWMVWETTTQEKVMSQILRKQTQTTYYRRQATSHYLNQWWFVLWHIYASLGLNGLTKKPRGYQTPYLCWTLLTHWGRDKMATILRKTFSNAFFCMKIFIFRVQVPLRSRPMLTDLHQYQFWLITCIPFICDWGELMIEYQLFETWVKFIWFKNQISYCILWVKIFDDLSEVSFRCLCLTTLEMIGHCWIS